MKGGRTIWKWKEAVKDLLDMHREERRGVVVMGAILLLLLGWVVYEQWLRGPVAYDLSQQQKWIDAWIAQQSEVQRDSTPLSLFNFDPNTIGREEWKMLGLTERQIDGVERYQAKGGKFRTKKDLARMYSIKPDQFAVLEPFILLPDSLFRKTNGRSGPPTATWHRESPQVVGATIGERVPYERHRIREVELNTADTTALVALPGIGPAFARGIVKYRDLLGGFVHLDQLNEVYVLKDKPDALLKLKEFLILDTLAVRRIPINSCSVEELAAHPYARWGVAKPLIAFRSQHGPFAKVTDIKQCVVVTPAVFAKLAPYLTVE